MQGESANSDAARKLGGGVTMAITIANMIGTGVFVSAGYQAASLGHPLIMLSTWLVGGLLAWFGASAYAELATAMPNVGGEYVYLRELYHPTLGFASGWVSLTAGFSAPIAAAALLFAGYLGRVVPSLSGGITPKLVAAGLIAAVAALHAFDNVFGSRVQAGFTLAKVALIVMFVGMGLSVGAGSWSHLDAAWPASFEINAYAISLMYVGFAYSGWNAAAYIAGEVRTPQRTLPRALMGGTAVVTVLYTLLNITFLYALPVATLAHGDKGGPIGEVGDAAARALFGETIGRGFTYAIALALVSTVSAMVMAGPRVYAAMADDRALPRWLGARNARGVPARAVPLQVALAWLFVFLGKPDALILYAGFWLSLFASITVCGVWLLRRRGTHAPYRMPWVWGAAGFVGLSLWSAYAQLHRALTDAPLEFALFAGTLLVGGAVYMVAQRQRWL